MLLCSCLFILYVDVIRKKDCLTKKLKISSPYPIKILFIYLSFSDLGFTLVVSHIIKIECPNEFKLTRILMHSSFLAKPGSP